MSSERGPYKNIRRNQDRGKFVDTHELLKAEIYRQGEDLEYKFAVANTTPGMQPIISSAAPSAAPAPVTVKAEVEIAKNGIEDYYLYFDSISRDTGSDLANGELKFSITQLNNTQPINNLVELQIMDDFYFQAPKNNAAKPDYYFFRRAYMQIASLPNTQSVQTVQNLFHYEFEVDNLTSTAVKLTPTRDRFYFRQPINGLNEIIFRFFVPSGLPDGSFRRIPLMLDTLNVSILNNNPAIITILGGADVYNIVDQNIATAFPYVLPAPGIAIYISDLTAPSSPTATNVMDPQGWYITQLDTATQFRIGALDTTLLGAPFNAKVIIPKNRIAFYMKFSCIKNTITNYLIPTHV